MPPSNDTPSAVTIRAVILFGFAAFFFFLLSPLIYRQISPRVYGNTIIPEIDINCIGNFLGFIHFGPQAFYYHFYIIFLIVAGSITVMTLLLRRQKWNFLFLRELFFFLTLSFCLSIALWQSAVYLKIFIQNDPVLSSKTTEEKYLILYPKPFLFSKNVHDNVSLPHTCRLVTDMDMTRWEGMQTERLLSYFLYPVLEFRNVWQQPVDCIICYEKKDALKEIPAGYRILFKESDTDLIAVKEK